MTVLDQHAAPVTIQLAQPTANRRVTVLTLTPGVVDDQAREMFLYAQCQLLALAGILVIGHLLRRRRR